MSGTRFGLAVRLFVLTTGVLFVASQASAAVIVEYDFTGAAGNQASTSASTVAANVTALSVTRGSGLAAASAANTFNSVQWSSNPLEPTVDYISFGIASISPGFAATINQIAFSSQVTQDGPRDWGLRSSLDNFATNLTTWIQGASGALTNVSFNPNLSGLTGPVEFRMYAITNTNANPPPTNFNPAGEFRLGTTNSRLLTISGTVEALSAVPEPSALLMALIGAAACVGASRTRRSSVRGAAPSAA